MSVFRQAGLAGEAVGAGAAVHLTLPIEKELAVLLSQYPDLLLRSAEQHEPHNMCHYLSQLAGLFHSYYNANKFLVEDQVVREARLGLIAAVRQVLINGLMLLGVSAPDE